MSKKVLVFGDIIIDRYIHVSSTRMAAEADVPVCDVVKVDNRAGGAANVAANVRSLLEDDNEVTLLGVFSADIFPLPGVNDSYCPISSPMIKERFISPDLDMLFRVDNFKKFSAGLSSSILSSLFKMKKNEEMFDCLVVSDYDKGTVTKETFDVARTLCRGNIIVDSKRKDLSIFEGSDLLKVNESEYDSQLSGVPYSHVESLFKRVIVTRGAAGADIKEKEPHNERSSYAKESYKISSINVPAPRVSPVDVTGCGDTHTAAMACYLLFNDDVHAAVKFANSCAADVVQRFGTAVPHSSLAKNMIQYAQEEK